MQRSHQSPARLVDRVLIIFLLYLAGSIQVSRGQDSLQFTSGDLKLYPLLYQQASGEYKALCYQAYNLARMVLDDALEKNPGKKNLAIITDIDETILDNSDVTAQKIKTNKPVVYKDWLNWLNSPGLPTVPGAVDFFRYAGSKGVQIFYISNRSVNGLQITISILQKLKLPDPDTSHMLFLTDDFSKESRREAVMKNYNVIMLFGDDLDDFMQVFESRSPAGRRAATDKLKKEWGKKFIILPNPVYGDWQNALFDYQDTDSLPLEQKIAKLTALLKGLELN
jgi:5'-nucleotidase (lipoprotein e(P4) family)